MPKHPMNEPEEFYAEIFRTEDPFSGLSTEIEDDHESADYDQIRGLSDEQVSQIARDALEQTRFSSHGEAPLHEHGPYLDNNSDSRA